MVLYMRINYSKLRIAENIYDTYVSVSYIKAFNDLVIKLLNH